MLFQNSLKSCVKIVAATLLVSCGPNQSSSSSAVFGLNDNSTVAIYQENQPVEHFSSNIQTSAADLGTKAEQIRLSKAVTELLDTVGKTLPKNATLVPYRFTSDKKGLSLRFVEFIGQTAVDGGEAVAIFNQDGKLVGLNLSIKDVTAADDAAVPAGEVLELAKVELNNLLGARGLKLPSYIQASKLVFAETAHGWQQVWRIDLPSFRVDVIASGMHVGDIVSLRNANTGFTGKLKIYNGRYVPLIATDFNKGILVLDHGKETDSVRLGKLVGRKLITPGVLATQDNMRLTTRFYHDVFGRDGYDDKGASITAIADLGTGFFSLQGANASWNAAAQIFSFGIGNDIFDDLAKASDVVGHEFTHAVISNSSNLEYFSETGALNEHFADVFGEFVQHFGKPDSTPFLMGETVARSGKQPIRNMLKPQEGLAKQPGKMSEIKDEYKNHCEGQKNPDDNCGVHNLSGIPNVTAAKVITAIGWEKAHWLYYRVMTARVLSNSRFVDYMRQIKAECALQLDASDCAILDSAFADAEIVDAHAN